jgi:NAD(P)-dependent dehydrogenase (short-subunit alcohol dehydrogenase family)
MAIIDRFRLDGKVAVVNGGSRGIGAAIALGLAEQGAQVVVSSRKLEACESVAQGIRDSGYKAVAMACHGGKTEQIDALIASVAQQFGRLDILINNGGTNPYYGLVGETPMDAFDKTVEVNLRGPMYFSGKAVEMMKVQGGGAIVNVASVNGIRPGMLQGVYSTTKAALINMSLAFAREYGHDNIRVNALCPGLVDTKLAAVFKQDEAALDKALQPYPISRMAQPEEMVAAVLFMVSEAGSFYTGQSMAVDGGATATLL